MFSTIDVLGSWCFWQLMFSTVDVLGQKVDVLVVDVLEVDQMGRPEALGALSGLG